MRFIGIFGKKKSKKVRKKPKDATVDSLLEIEFCPGMIGTFDVLYSQRRHLARIVSRWGALRPRVDDWRAEIVVKSIEEVNDILEKNIGEILNLLIIGGYDPRKGIYQPEFEKEQVNKVALKSYAAENAELLDELDDLITAAVEYSAIRAETKVNELRAWSASFRSIKNFDTDFKASKIA